MPKPRTSKPKLPKAGRSRRRYASRLPIEARTEQLLDSALRLVAESGFGAVSMHAVARHTGVTRPVAYDCFAGRTDLLAALVSREEARMRAVFTDAAVADRSGAADQRGLPAETLRTFLTAVRDAPDTWRLLYVPLEAVPEESRERLTAARAELLSLLRTQFTRYAAANHFPADLDVDVAVHLLRAIVEMAGARVLLDPDRYPPDRMATALTAFLDAFRPARTTPSDAS
jgi:AcrR family transcriptional regulator